MAGVLTCPARTAARAAGSARTISRPRAGRAVRVAIKAAPRRLPPDFAGPLLLVGAGTGLAPLYGILEDRVARGAGAAGRPVALYSGCRSPASSCSARSDRMAREGYLARLAVAFSRQGPAKAYVQDALDGDGARSGTSCAAEGHFMICGDAKMAQDVEERMLRCCSARGGWAIPARSPSCRL